MTDIINRQERGLTIKAEARYFQIFDIYADLLGIKPFDPSNRTITKDEYNTVMSHVVDVLKEEFDITGEWDGTHGTGNIGSIWIALTCYTQRTETSEGIMKAKLEQMKRYAQYKLNKTI